MREKNSERPDMRDNRSKNSIKTGIKTERKKRIQKTGNLRLSRIRFWHCLSA